MRGGESEGGDAGMTHEQATALVAQIAIEAQRIEARVVPMRNRGRKKTAVHLRCKALNREIVICQLKHWESIKEAWELSSPDPVARS